jgi:hypothetical protein
MRHRPSDAFERTRHSAAGRGLEPEMIYFEGFGFFFFGGRFGVLSAMRHLLGGV